MNGLRPAELFELLRALDQEGAASRTAPVVATVISVDGSVYERTGAMAVFISGAASRTGVLDIGELEPPLAETIRGVAESGRARLETLELARESALVGWGLGAPGRVELFFERAGPALRGELEQARRALTEGKGVVISLELDGPEPGRRQLSTPEEPAVAACYRDMTPELVESFKAGRARRHLVFPIHPMGKALLFGSSRDASILAAHLRELGFSVFVGDPRPGRLSSSDWDRKSLALIEGGWDAVRAAAGPDEETAVVAMTHSYSLDLEILAGALASPAPYVGVVGARARGERLEADLAARGVKPRPGQWRAPAGLDIGAEAPRELALAVAAEILAARWGRKGGRLSARRAAPSAGQAGPAGTPKVPGLILAAGRGRRFGKGQKLAASVDGRPVLRHAVENALASRLDPVIVVLGCEAGRALEALRGLEDPKLRVVFNPLWEGGKGSSIECGLREVPSSSAGVVSLLGDMPRVSPALIDRVIAEFERSGRLVFPVYPGPTGPTKGYPTAFPRALFGEMRALTGDGTADEAVRRHWAEALRIPLKDGSTQADVDTAADLELLAQAPSQGEGLDAH